MPGDKALYAVLVAARRTTVCRKRRSSYHRFRHLRRHCRLTLHQTQLTTFALEQEVHRQTVCFRALPSTRYRRRNCGNWKLGATALHNDNRSGWQASDEVTPAAFLWMTAWPTSRGYCDWTNPEWCRTTRSAPKSPIVKRSPSSVRGPCVHLQSAACAVAPPILTGRTWVLRLFRRTSRLCKTSRLACSLRL